MLQSLIPAGPRQDSSLLGAGEGSDLDRRHLLRFLGIGMGGTAREGRACPWTAIPKAPANVSAIQGCSSSLSSP
jgi:hypothetical protein